MKTTVTQLKKRAEDLPESFRKYVDILSATPPYRAVVKPFNDPTHSGYLVQATSSGADIDIDCACPEDGLCDHMAAFFQYLLDVKQGTLPVAEEPATEAVTETLEVITIPPDDPTPSFTPAVIHPSATAPAILRPEMPIDELLAYQNQMSEMITRALEKDRDFGVIPGTKKPTLLKPGAERIAMAFGVYPEYSVSESTVNHDFENAATVWENASEKKPANWEELKAAGKGRNRKDDDGTWHWQTPSTVIVKGLYTYRVRTILRKRGTDAIVGTGEGECSSLESKYQNRPRDMQNTILKMAQKRAFVAAVLNTFALSDRFTQDVEDM